MGQCYYSFAAHRDMPLLGILQILTVCVWFIFKNGHTYSCFLWPSVLDFMLESNIEDFIQSLKHQNILLEVDDFENRNGTEDPSYNGAIIVSGKRKVCLPLASCVCFYEKKLKCYILADLNTVKSQPS